MRFLKGAVIFLLGAGVGTTGSYLYFKKKYDEKKEELNELREHYLGKIEKEDALKKVDNIIKEEGYISFDNLSDEGIKEVIRSVEARTFETDRPSEDYPEEPIIITEEDYSERELSFDKYEVDYYVGDSALVNENDEMIEAGDVVGYENLEQFIADESEEVMYIRNASSGADYMVKKVYGNYSDIIGLGGDEYDD